MNLLALISDHLSAVLGILGAVLFGLFKLQQGKLDSAQAQLLVKDTKDQDSGIKASILAEAARLSALEVERQALAKAAVSTPTAPADVEAFWNKK